MYQPPAPAAPVDPIIARLRPRTVGEVLDQAFRLYRRHFLTFIAIIAIIHVPLQLLEQVSYVMTTDFISSAMSYDPASYDPAGSNAFYAYFGVAQCALLLLTLLFWLIEQLSQGALTAAVADNYLDKPVSFGGAYRAMLPHAWRLLGVMLLQVGIMGLAFVPAILCFAVAIVSSFDLAFRYNGPSTALACASFLLLIPAFVALAYVITRMSVAMPALIVERLRPVEAIRRSWRLVEGYGWRTFGLQVLLIGLWLAVSEGPATLIAWLMGLAAPQDFVVQEVIGGTVTVFIMLLYIPIQLIAVTLYYFDLRVRKEGYDLEAAMEQRYPVDQTPAWAGTAYGDPPQYNPYLQQYPQGPLDAAKPNSRVAGVRKVRLTPRT